MSRRRLKRQTRVPVKPYVPKGTRLKKKKKLAAQRLQELYARESTHLVRLERLYSTGVTDPRSKKVLLAPNPRMEAEFRMARAVLVRKAEALA